MPRANAWRIAAACLLVPIAAACVRTNAALLGGVSPRPAISPDSVALYRVAAQVPFEYEEIALLNAAGDATWTDERMMFDSMRKKAARMGANAVILAAVSEPSAGAKVAGAVLGTGTARKGQAIAIFMFRDRPKPTGRDSASTR